MAWWEANRFDCLFGLARNERLVAEIGAKMAAARAEAEASGNSARRLRDFPLSTRDRWIRSRRVIGKAAPGRRATPARASSSPLPVAEVAAQSLHGMIYCARGETGNRIKECQLDLFADHISAATLRANQLRLWFALLAYVLMGALRWIGLAHTQFADATCGAIRLRLLKIGALVRVSARRVAVAMASACPWQREFALAHAMLRRAGA